MRRVLEGIPAGWCGKALRRVTAVLALGTIAIGAAAQQAAPEVRLEKVEVTGTNIRRIEGESGLPVQVITRAEIERGGIMDAKDILDRISAVQSFGSWTESRGVGSGLAGYTAASLRGLGPERTLVLLNGRRLAAYALSGGQSVDLSGIPASAIERVEVLKDGASAVYGTDAIGGVINFILRKDYRGIEAGATYLATEHGGGDNWRASLTAGWGNLEKDGFNAFVNVDHMRQDALRSAERDFSRTSYLPDYGVDRTSSNSFPANIRQPGGFGNSARTTFNPTIPLTGASSASCLPPYSFPTIGFPLRCAFDYAAIVDNIPKSEKTNVVGRASWQMNADHQLFAEGSYYRGEYVYKVSPTPVNGNFTNTPMLLPPDSPYYPASFVAGIPRGNPNLPLGLSYRLVELGPRTNTPDVEQWRAIVGLQGVFRNWDYQLTGGYTANKQVDNYAGGYVSEELFGPLLRSGAVNPFGYNTPAVLRQMQDTQIIGPVSRNRANHFGGEFKASGAPWDLRAGPLALAFGLEGRREGLEQVNSAFLYTGDVIGGGGVTPSFTERYREVWSMFGEANVPIAKGLEANLAVRFDHYSDFGGTTNPKFTVRWQPHRDLVLRGSVGTGFRAPTLFDLFVPNTYSLIEGYDDPLRCPVTQADEDCQSGSAFRGKSGANPDLKPEKSKQVNVGFVVEPLAGLSMSVDYYQVRIDDLITTIPLDAILLNDYARWAPTLVVRKPPDPAYPNLPGPIDYIVQTPINAGSKRTSGIDIDLRYRAPAMDLGRFALSLSGTYLLTYKASEFEAIAPGTADDINGNGALSRWRHYAALDWSRGAWGATLAQNFQDGFSEIDPKTCDASGVCTGRRHVGTYSVIDLFGRYEGVRNLKVQLGVRNLLDRAPPSSFSTGGFQVGYDPTYADPRGRMFYASIRYAFR